MRTLVAALAATTAIVAVACGDDSGGGADGAGANSGTGANNNGSGAENGSGANNGTGADGFGANNGFGANGNLLGGNGQGGNGFEGCEGESEAASFTPVNMFITFDKSGSMSSNNKWTNSTNALKDFFANPATVNLNVALRFFPDDQPVAGCGCDFNACGTMLVPLGKLVAQGPPIDTQQQALIDAIDSTGPTGLTPMYGALGGAVQAAEQHLAANPGEQAVVIIVGDGAPTECNTNSSAITGLAADGFTNGVLTYAIGLQGSNETLMNDIAAAGGTNQAFFIGNGNTSADLLNALLAIQGSTVSCDFVVPQTSASGETVDPSKVNVLYDNGSGMPETIPQVASEADCGATPGWYYDNPNDPSTLSLCPSFCTQVQENENAGIELEFGCLTMGPN